MIKVTGVRFRQAGKVYYFDPKNLKLERGSHVIVETARGIEYGTVIVPPKGITDDEVVQPLKAVIRVATPEDDRIEERNHEKEKEAYKICLEKIEKHGLAMKLVQAEYTHLRTTAVLSYISDRVRTGVHQDGKGTESVPESDQDFRCMRQIDVLFEK